MGAGNTAPADKGSVCDDVQVAVLPDAAMDEELAHLSVGKGRLYRAYREGVERAFGRAGVEIEEPELANIARVGLEMSGIDVSELYAPSKVQSLSSCLGLKPGLSLDLNGRKANSEAWNFTRDGDEKEWFEELRAEDPYLVVGSRRSMPLFGCEAPLRFARF